MNAPELKAAWLDALRRRDSAALVALIGRCPPSAERDEARIKAPDQDGVTLMTLAHLALTLLWGSQPVLANAIAGAVGEIAREALATTVSPPMLVVAEWAAEVETRSLGHLRSGDEVVDMAATWLSWLEAHGSRTKSGVLSLTAASARLDEGRPEEALTWLARADASPVVNPADQESREGIRRQLSSALQSATELPTSPAEYAVASDQRIASNLEEMRSRLWAVPPERRARIASVLDRMEASLTEHPLDPISKDDELDAELLDAFGFPAPPGSVLMLQQNMRRLVLEPLQNPVRGRDSAALAECISNAGRLRADAQALGRIPEQNTLAWAIAVCRRRRNEHDAAIGTLKQLWRSLELERAQIQEPASRAGVLATFPHLFVALADSLYRAARRDEILEVIEGSKGRLLEDRLVRDAAVLTPPATQSALPRHLPNGSHLLSFLVDDECIFAGLLTNKGSHHVERVELSRGLLRTYAADIDPSTWGRSLGGFARRVPSDLPDALAPLVSWLEPLVKAGILLTDDHLCYSPDDELHLIPLHLLNFAGKPLIESFSVSRLHAVRGIDELPRHPIPRPRRGCIVEVSAAEDEPAKAAGFHETGDALTQLMPSDRLAGARATVDALCARELTDRVVHFTTHGTFPKAANTGVDPNPFRSSGLLLATTAGLPSLTITVAGQTDAGLLSPERIGPLRLTRSHVTTQACSSGLAREGAGGDALGVELALLLGGASSTLTTNWDVPLGPSTEFCRRFYERWLGQPQLSRAVAWREAALSMKNEGRPLHEWAAFTLAGDWR